MTSMPSLPWMQERPVSNLDWVKQSPRIADHLCIRTTPTAYWLMTYISTRAAEADITKTPGETEVRISLFELRQACRKSVRCIEYAIEEIGPTHTLTDPARLKKVRKETGLDTVGKNFVEIRSTRPGEWFCKLLPQNWTQGPGSPGQPMTKTARKPRTLRGSHAYEPTLAAMSAPQTIAPQPFESAGPDDDPTQASVPQTIAPYATQTFAPGSQPSPQRLLYRRTASDESSQPFAPGTARHSSESQRVLPQGTHLRTPTHPTSGNPAVPCEPTPPILTELDRPPTEENLASWSKPFTQAETEELKKLIAGMHGRGLIRDLGPLNEQTARNLLIGARQSMPGPVEVAEFVAYNAKPWKSWGGAVAAIRSDFRPWLHRTGWIDKSGPIWGGSAIASIAVEPIASGPFEDPMAGVPDDPGTEWARIRTAIEQQLSPQAYQNWFVRTRQAALERDNLIVFVPDDITRKWMMEEYAELVAASIKNLNLPVVSVVYRTPRAT